MALAFHSLSILCPPVKYTSFSSSSQEEDANGSSITKIVLSLKLILYFFNYLKHVNVDCQSTINDYHIKLKLSEPIIIIILIVVIIIIIFIVIVAVYFC